MHSSKLPSYRVRPATESDLSEVIRLRLAFLADLGNTEIPEDFYAVSLDYMQTHLANNTFLCQVGEVNGQIVSTGVICLYEYLPRPYNLSGKAGYLYSVYTLPEHRGKGIGGQVVNAVIQQAKDAGAGELFLHAEDKAVPIYRRAGFVPLENSMVLRLDG